MNMFSKWDIAVPAPWARSLELKSLSLSDEGVELSLQSEEGAPYRIFFHGIQGVRVTAFECAFEVVRDLPEGGLFVADQSDWLRSLGKGKKEMMKGSRHFVVRCYDSIVEVAATAVVTGNPKSGD